MIRELPVLSEREGRGFKTMFPNKYSELPRLKAKINPNPKTPEEAIENRKISEEIKKWEESQW